MSILLKAHVKVTFYDHSMKRSASTTDFRTDSDDVKSVDTGCTQAENKS